MLIVRWYVRVCKTIDCVVRRSSVCLHFNVPLLLSLPTKRQSNISLTCSASIRFSSSSTPDSGQFPYTCVWCWWSKSCSINRSSADLPRGESSSQLAGAITSAAVSVEEDEAVDARHVDDVDDDIGDAGVKSSWCKPPPPRKKGRMPAPPRRCRCRNWYCCCPWCNDEDDDEWSRWQRQQRWAIEVEIAASFIVQVETLEIDNS